MYIQSTGDPIADLEDDVAAEERGRALSSRLIDMTDEEDLKDGLKFIREREIVHSIRFREAINLLKGLPMAFSF
jgi:spore coat protein JC